MGAPPMMIRCHDSHPVDIRYVNGIPQRFHVDTGNPCHHDGRRDKAESVLPPVTPCDPRCVDGVIEDDDEPVWGDGWQGAASRRCPNLIHDEL